MARIDKLISSLKRFGASAVVIPSGDTVRFRFPTGDRPANQKAEHKDVVGLVQEIAPPEAQAGLLVGQPTDFPYEFESESFCVRVDPRPNAWSLIVGREKPQKDGPSARQPNAGVQTPKNREPAQERMAEPRVAPSAPKAPASKAKPSAKPQAPPAAKPQPKTNAKDVDSLLRTMCDMGASDLHLCTGAPPYVRVHGDMMPLKSCGAYDAQGLSALLDQVMPEQYGQEFAERNDTDFAYEIPGLSRFRVNVFRDRRGPGSVIRAIPFEILTPDQLGLSEEVLQLCFLSKGLVLVTGPTGSGKSTTLAALVDHINRHRSDHIITIEDPIEFIHENKKCLVNQREVHQHTESFKDALRAALREDPDIVLVGEMRDLETISIAVETAETGHLVFGTLHTTTAPSTVDRIIDQFPPDQQEQIRQMVAESLRGVIAQNLCRKKGGGRVAAFEVLIGSPAVSNLVREKKTFQLLSLMQTGRKQGMVTMADSLIDLVRKGVVEPFEAYTKAPDKLGFQRLLKAEGHEISVGDGPVA